MVKDIGPMIKKIDESIERRVNEEMKPYHLTRIQAVVVMYLHARDNQTATQKELETYLAVSHPTTVTILKSMEKKGMVRFEQDQKDRRMKNVTLIWQDEEMIHALEANAKAMEARLLKGFSEGEKALFREFCERAEKNLA